MNCKHEQIRTWVFEDTKESAGMWSCVKCGLKFEPINQHKTQQRPQNCGTGYCSCIECPYEQPEQQESEAVHAAWMAGYTEGEREAIEKLTAQQQEPVAGQPLPCPFCGHIGLDFSDGDTYRWGVASCGGCGASCGDIRREYPDEGKWHSEAIAEWNKRTSPPASKPWVGLTDEEIETYRYMIDWTAEWSYIKFARAIEAAHGIKGVDMTDN